MKICLINQFILRRSIWVRLFMKTAAHWTNDKVSLDNSAAQFTEFLSHDEGEWFAVTAHDIKKLYPLIHFIILSNQFGTASLKRKK